MARGSRRQRHDTDGSAHAGPTRKWCYCGPERVRYLCQLDARSHHYSLTRLIISPCRAPTRPSRSRQLCALLSLVPDLSPSRPRLSSSSHRSPMDSKPEAHAAAAPPSAYPRMSPEDLAPPPPPVVAPAGSNPYVLSSPSSGPPAKSTKENLREMFGSVGKRFGEAARKTEGIAGDVWQHLKTGPSITDAAMGRIAQISKVISEGGYDKIFQQTFECLPDEKLKKAYACYLSTSHGPIMGVLYVSTAKLAFCSDSPVAYVTEDNQTASAIYKIVVPVHHLRSVTPTASQQNPAERYIQVVSVDNHDFWFMGFVNYDSAVKCLQEAARGGA